MLVAGDKAQGGGALAEPPAVHGRDLQPVGVSVPQRQQQVRLNTALSSIPIVGPFHAVLPSSALKPPVCEHEHVHRCSLQDVCLHTDRHQAQSFLPFFCEGLDEVQL